MLDRDTLLTFMKQPDYAPMKRAELAVALDLHGDDRSCLNRLLRELVDDGVVVRLKRKGFALSDAADLVAGTISFARSGVAFVCVPGDGPDVFIPPRFTYTALPGDHVLVRLDRASVERAATEGGKGPEGQVIRILERRRSRFVGVLRRSGSLLYVRPQHATVDRDIAVDDAAGATLNDRVLVELTEWDDPRTSPLGVIREVIGPVDDPSLDTVAVLHAHDLTREFPPEVVAEAEQAAITEAMLADRLDLRERFVFTIDPASARDFDDAISLEPKGDGWLLGVHIADVSAFVRRGTALDREARSRGTSVYLPDTVVPMLPEHLSNGLCSLNPNVDRLAFSAMLELTSAAKVRQATFAPSVIRSQLRLTYEQALAVLESEPGGPLPDCGCGIDEAAAAVVRQAHRLAQMLRVRRLSEGALELEMPEVRFDLGEDGAVLGVSPVPHDVSHQLIEEFMLLANESVCRELTRRGAPHLHRIHDAPDPEKLGELEEALLTAGIPVGSLVSRKGLNAFLRNIAPHPGAHAWNMAVLRAMKKAAYSPENIGHFGLAKDNYDHFTSPIRRYPDLVVHRILRAVLAGSQPPYSKDDLQQLGLHCSRREEVALAAEREAVEMKRLRYFDGQLKAPEPKQFEAVVTRVTNFGVFVDVPSVQAFGMIHVSRLEDDFYDFDAGRQQLAGRRGDVTLAAGSCMRVRVAGVDFDRRFLDFDMVPGSVRSGQLVPPANHGQPKKTGSAKAGSGRAKGGKAGGAKGGRRPSGDSRSHGKRGGSRRGSRRR